MKNYSLEKIIKLIDHIKKELSLSNREFIHIFGKQFSKLIEESELRNLRRSSRFELYKIRKRK